MFNPSACWFLPFKIGPIGAPLTVQWLKLRASTIGGIGSILGLKTKTLHLCHAA